MPSLLRGGRVEDDEEWSAPSDADEASSHGSPVPESGGVSGRRRGRRGARGARGGRKAAKVVVKGSRNRVSAHRSRQSFAQKSQFLLRTASALESAFSVLRCHAEESGLEVGAAVGRAEKDVLSGFEAYSPPKRNAGVRMTESDEALEQRAATGDVAAQRALKNRASARESRKRRWDVFNDATRRILVLLASVNAVRALLHYPPLPHFPLPPPTSPRLPESPSHTSFDPSFAPSRAQAIKSVCDPTGKTPLNGGADAAGMEEEEEEVRRGQESGRMGMRTSGGGERRVSRRSSALRASKRLEHVKELEEEEGEQGDGREAREESVAARSGRLYQPSAKRPRTQSSSSSITSTPSSPASSSTPLLEHHISSSSSSSSSSTSSSTRSTPSPFLLPPLLPTSPQLQSGEKKGERDGEAEEEEEDVLGGVGVVLPFEGGPSFEDFLLPSPKPYALSTSASASSSSSSAAAPAAFTFASTPLDSTVPFVVPAVDD